MTAPRFIWTVYGFDHERRYKIENVASFFDHGDAVHFANRSGTEGFVQRTLHIDAGRYDRRTSGYRFTPPEPVPSYREWLASLDAPDEQLVEVHHLGPGRIAA